MKKSLFSSPKTSSILHTHSFINFLTSALSLNYMSLYHTPAFWKALRQYLLNTSINEWMNILCSSGEILSTISWLDYQVGTGVPILSQPQGSYEKHLCPCCSSVSPGLRLLLHFSTLSTYQLPGSHILGPHSEPMTTGTRLLSLLCICALLKIFVSLCIFGHTFSDPPWRPGAPRMISSSQEGHWFAFSILHCPFFPASLSFPFILLVLGPHGSEVLWGIYIRGAGTRLLSPTSYMRDPGGTETRTEEAKSSC